MEKPVWLIYTGVQGRYSRPYDICLTLEAANRALKELEFKEPYLRFWVETTTAHD